MNDDTIQQFLAESRAHLVRLRDRAASLGHRASPESLAEMQGDVQAIATACGFLGLKDVWTAARQAETVLLGLRKAAPNGDNASIGLMIDRLDAIAAELDELESPAANERWSTPGPVLWAVDDDFDAEIFDDEDAATFEDETERSEPMASEPEVYRLSTDTAIPEHEADDSFETSTAPESASDSVPNEPATAPSYAADDSVTSGDDPERVRVLVVDDSLFYRELVRIALEAEGFEVEAVADVAAAERRIEQGASVDCIVCELDLPGGGGYELVESLRSRADVSQLVALSARSAETGRDEALAAGFDRFVTKYSTRELVTAINAGRTDADRADAGGIDHGGIDDGGIEDSRVETAA